MKPTITLLLFLLLFTTTVFGQDTTVVKPDSINNSAQSHFPIDTTKFNKSFATHPEWYPALVLQGYYVPETRQGYVMLEHGNYVPQYGYFKSPFSEDHCGLYKAGRDLIITGAIAELPLLFVDGIVGNEPATSTPNWTNYDIVNANIVAIGLMTAGLVLTHYGKVREENHPNRFPGYDQPLHRKHNACYKVGESFLYPGLIAFGPVVLIDYLSNPPGPGANQTPPGVYAAVGIDLGIIAVGGTLMYLAHRHEKHHHQFLSLVGKGNQLGIAYNF